MANQKTKKYLIIDHDDKYIPVVKKTTGEIQLCASFSLAEQAIRSRDRLKQLIDFIHRNSHDTTRRIHNGEFIGMSHRLTAQVVYLAYWGNYPLEFQIEGGTDIVVRVHLTRQPELTITLDLFKNKVDPYAEIQRWWQFFCETISAHAEIWHIPLAVDECVYRKLIPGDYPRVQVDILPTIQEKG